MSIKQSRLVRACAVVAALAVGPLMLAAPAQAATVAWNDPAGDMYQYDPETDGFVAAPEQTNGDVTRTSVKHARRAVIVRQRFTALDKTGEIFWDMMAIRTSAGRGYQLDVFAGRGFWAGESELTTFSGRPVRCRLSHKIDYAEDTLYVRIPRGCLKDPRWIKAQLMSFTFVDDGSEEGAVFVDDPHSGGVDFTRTTPRIRRG